MSVEHHEVAIVGAGFSGIGLAIKLDEAGIKDLVILEAGDGVGGAWHWNTYPGVGVDIPSFSYQFSFAPSTKWTRIYARGGELKSYAEKLVDDFELRGRLRLNTKINRAVFDEENDIWRISTTDGASLTARHLISATGVFTQPQPPDFDGLEDFRGELMHTARWDQEVSLTDRRVAIIGTGASAVQVIPSIASRVAELTVFQRTPVWCLPKADHPLSATARGRMESVPFLRRAARAISQVYVEATFPIAAHYHRRVPLSRFGERSALRLLEQQVHDPSTREALTPKYRLGCKRPTFSNDYLRTFNQPNVKLETTPIERFTDAGIQTTDGERHSFDMVILATGFKVFEHGNMPPFPVSGVEGVDLEGWWDENRLQAYEGVSVPGFPNYFMVLGPYGYNGASYFQLIENQARHIVRCLRHAREHSATRIEVTRPANDRYAATMRARRPNSVFADASCSAANSYYFDQHGDTPFRHSTSVEARWRSSRFPITDYRFERGPVSRS